jgi:hypothetical protein
LRVQLINESLGGTLENDFVLLICFMDIRAGSYIPDLSLQEDVRIDTLNCLDCFFGLGQILFEGQRGEINTHCIKARFRRLHLPSLVNVYDPH